MGRKAILSFVAVACLGFLALGFWSMDAKRHRINRDGYEAIQVGMTLKDVETILRRPAGSYNTGRLLISPNSPTFREKWWLSDDDDWKEWASDEGHITVELKDGNVVRSCFIDVLVVKPSFLDRVRTGLGF